MTRYFANGFHLTLIALATAAAGAVSALAAGQPGYPGRLHSFRRALIRTP